MKGITNQMTRKMRAKSATRHRITQSLSLMGLIQLGCAGPTTPLGAVRAYFPNGGRLPHFLERSLGSLDSFTFPSAPPQIHFNPRRQVLHRAHPLTVTIEDSAGINDDFELQVAYNGFDVSGSFLRQAHLKRDPEGRRLAVTVPSVSLSPDAEHAIEFSYRNARGTRVRAGFQPPVCQAFSGEPLGGLEVEPLDRFRPSPALLLLIEKLSRESGLNPMFTAGLIAKESSFQPSALSSARALGLTQMTSLAEIEIADSLIGWPRYEGLSTLPVPLLRGLILSGAINAHNEWRLDPEKSVRGGLAFLLFLYDRWSSAENNRRMQNVADFESVPALRMRLVLASYNAGFSRVSEAFRRDPRQWQQDPALRSIHRYINQVVSLCDRFSQPKEPHG